MFGRWPKPGPCKCFGIHQPGKCDWRLEKPNTMPTLREGLQIERSKQSGSWLSLQSAAGMTGHVAVFLGNGRRWRRWRVGERKVYLCTFRGAFSTLLYNFIDDVL